MNATEKSILSTGMNSAVEYLEGIESRSVSPAPESIKNMAAFDEPLPNLGKDPIDTIHLLHKYGSPATIGSNGKRYFGFVIGGSHPATLAADWLTSAWDQNGGLIATSPANAKIELITEKWLTEILPVAKTSRIGFVTGVTVANFCALAAARTAILEKQGWDVEADGLFGAPPITVVIGEEAHGSVLKALSMVGFGRERVIRVPTDANGRMCVDQIPQLNSSTILCLQAGNVNTGSMDDGSIIEKAKTQGAWVHIDGAFGLWAGASQSKKHLTASYELADSWATDGHKWLNVPYDSGLVICREGKHLQKAMTMSGDYLDQQGDRIPYHYTPELSKRARAIDIWAAIRTLGRKGIDELITRTCDYAKYFAEKLEAAGYEVLNEVETNQVLVAFGSDENTHEVIKSIQQEGTCWCGGTLWRGRAAMRISVSSCKTTQEDVEASLQAMLKVAKARKKP